MRHIIQAATERLEAAKPKANDIASKISKLGRTVDDININFPIGVKGKKSSCDIVFWNDNYKPNMKVTDRKSAIK